MGVLTTSRPVDCNEDAKPSIGKENATTRPFLEGSDILCPVSTSSALAIAEEPELRAYKLGKQKCSYNQVELVIKDMTSGTVSELIVSEAIEASLGPEVDEQLRGSCLKFNVRFVDNSRMQLYIYVVYARPYGTTRSDKDTLLYHWMPVTRSKCRKGCIGSVIRGLQRFGKMPRRGAAALDGEDCWKEPRHLYIAIDEASTHVCARHETSNFRLLVAVYDDKDRLIGTTVSSSIRVLANNDAPLGAASFKLHCHLRGVVKASSLLQSNKVHLKEFPVPLQPRVPLQGLPPNMSPSRCKSTSNKVIRKNSMVPSAETTALQGFERERRKVPDEQGATIVVKEQQIKSGSHSDQCFHTEIKHDDVALVTERILLACASKPIQAVISSRTLANMLRTKRTLVADIFKVLQSIKVVQQQEKAKVIWLGGSLILTFIARLSREGHARGKPSVQDARLGSNPTGDNQLMEGSTGSVSKKILRLFLADVTIPVPLDSALTLFYNSSSENSKQIFSKGRRLKETLSIFEALHLIKRTSDKSSSAITYKWLGAEAVIEHLNNLSGSLLTQGDVPHDPRYLERAGSPTRKRRSTPIESQGRQYRDDKLVSCLAEQDQETSENQPHRNRQPSRGSKRRFSDLSGEDDIPYYARLAGFHRRDSPPEKNKRTVVPRRPRLVTVKEVSYTFRNARNGVDISDARDLRHLSPSKKTQNKNPCQIGDSVIEPLQKRRGTCTNKSAECTPEPRHFGRGPEFNVHPSPRGTEGATDTAITALISMQTSVRATSTTIEMERNADDRTMTGNKAVRTSNASVAGGAQNTEIVLVDTIADTSNCGSGPNIFQFPYKKRPQNWSSVFPLPGPGSCEDLSIMTGSQPSFILNEDEQNHLLNFNPLYYLEQLFTPEQIQHLQAQNPAFLLQYVHYSRVLYHKLCAQTTNAETVVRPIAEHGAIEITSNLHTNFVTEEFSLNAAASPASHPPTIMTPLHGCSSSFSRRGVWLHQKDSDQSGHNTPTTTSLITKSSNADELSAPIAKLKLVAASKVELWQGRDSQQLTAVHHPTTSPPSCFEPTYDSRCLNNTTIV